MRKTCLVGLLSCLASAHANAQSNVTIYGTVDVTFETAKATGASVGANRNSYKRVTSNSSKLGFRGEEDLGGGLKAIYQVESSIAADTGGGNLGGRDTYVGLRGAFGTIVAGRLTGPSRVVGFTHDFIAGATGPGGLSSMLGKPNGGAGGGLFDERLNNTVLYSTPNFYGLSGSLAYSASENRTNDETAAEYEIDGSVWDLSVKYVNGPLHLAYSHGDLRNDLNSLASNVGSVGGAPVGTDDWKLDRVLARFEFEAGHAIGASWERHRQDMSTGKELERDIWALTGKYMVLQNTALIGHLVVARDSHGDFQTNRNTGARMIDIGVEHRLSKRTLAKVHYARIANDSSANYDFNVGPAGSTGNLSFGRGADPTVISVGLRHDF